ncbi:MAG: sensor histidine kinase [Hamadaea sp.]|nr:sensor histidine kinase [Hamadaea sp.]NUT20740.1 sensor histidine kinase [Hamadaea sp.]
MRRHHGPVMLDIGLAVGCTTVAMLLGREIHEDFKAFDGPGYLLTVAANMPLLFRRRAPLTTLICCAAGWLAFIVAGYWPALNPYATEVAYFTVASDRPRRVSIPAGAIGASVWTYAGLISRHASMASVGALSIAVTAILWKFGDNARLLAIRNRELAEATERLRREQAERARRAVVDERLRIAGELHDIVAHHMSVISIQAGVAGRVLPADPPTAQDAVEVIATSSREGQQELRRMLGLLRTPTAVVEDEDAALPAPGLARLDALLSRVRAAGVDVTVDVIGVRRALPPGLDLCAYRIVQESLTNVLKHAGPTSVTITLVFDTDRFTATVRDEGRRPGTPSVIAEPDGSGHGLIGMRERAALYGGTLDAGPDGPGFAVRLTLPL